MIAQADTGTLLFFATQGGNDVLSRSFKSLQPKLHESAGARRLTSSTQCFAERIVSYEAE